MFVVFAHFLKLNSSHGVHNYMTAAILNFDMAIQFLIRIFHTFKIQPKWNLLNHLFFKLQVIQ